MKKSVWKRNWKKILCLSALMSSFMAGTVSAAEPGEIISGEVKDEQVILYVQNPGEINQIACQVGTAACENVTYGAISDQEVPVQTLLLIDNSLSVSKEYRPMIGEIMNNLVANRMAGEQFTVATFSDKVNYLLEDSSDYAQLKQTIDGIEYADQETYLTDVLYEILKSWENDPESGYKRIIVVSDGVDNKAIGYTKEELQDLIEKQSYPIYSLGCKSKNGTNNDALENMFAISRMTKASYWLMNDIEDSMTVVSEVAEGNDVLRVEVDLPAEVCDGTPKGVKMTLQAGDAATEASLVLEMPFAAAETTTAAVETTAEEVEETEETEEVEEMEEIVPEEEKSESPFAFLTENPRIAIAAALAVVALIGAIVTAVVLVKTLKKKKESEQFEAAPEGAFARAMEPVSARAVKEDSTEMVGKADFGGDHTAMVWAPTGKSHMLILTDVNYPTRRFEVPINGTVVVGRSREDGCQIVLDYDKSVSRRHCQIRLDGTQMKVKDLGSRNKTFLGDDQEIIGEVAISSGCVLKLGNAKEKVELRG